MTRLRSAPVAPRRRGGSPLRRWLAAALLVLTLADPVAAQGVDARLSDAAARVEAGDLAGALPLLEEAVRADPGNTVARLELASVLLQLGQGARVRYHFALARGGRLSPETRAVVDGLLAGLPLRPGWQGSLGFALAPESNPARGSTGFLIVNGIPIEIGAAGAGESGKAFRVQASLDRQQPLSARTALVFGASLGAEFNTGRLADVVTLRPRARLRLIRGASRTDIGLRWTEQWADGTGLASGPGLTLAHSRPLGRRGTLVFNGTADDLTYGANPGLDGVNATGTLRYIHALSPATRLSVGMSVTRRNAASAASSFTAVRHSAGVFHSFAGGLTLGLTGARTRTWRDAPMPLFGIVQRDTRDEVSLTVSHSRLAVRGFAPTLTVGHETQASSIALNDYDNNRLSLGLTRRF
ncbi:surface lipoprotein assembly modifier [Jannaschia marina]|uniref:surface lipoprotein assembly modifier n=1 Tax=Jannaschia marina TaxID=2741674 RepID=UPI0015CC4A30|nr:surface lipoprotein assembly modifier [Jannaschia marina]